MKLLQDKIIELSKVPQEGILKVDNFLNHLIDPQFIIEIGQELAQRFEGEKIDKVLTLEASGIAPALGVALQLKIPLLFAKKSLPSTMSEGYHTKIYSFTKKKEFDIFVSKEYINQGEHILIVDDFLAMGHAVLGMKTLIEMGGATCAGVGIIIEKSFQEGRKLLIENGLHLESLVRLKRVSPPNIIEFI
ncbi:MAG: xanthine phosphoribosyltransferase [Brevinema sp.]